MAIDLYSKKDRNGRLLAPTDEQVAILNKYGFYQTAGSGDMGHFDYVGTQQSNDGKMKEAYLQRLKSGSMTNTEKSDIQNLADKEGRLDEFIEADKKGMKTYMTDGQFKVYNNAIDDFRNSEEAKEYKEIATNYEKVKSNLSQSGNPYADIGAIF
ncbi:MAG: hypothetical protein LBG59_07605 [Candidatus Peribacteria bacterium]|jgi:hypothetical protein|nr:hypothetical protein [Candidatus Peribacteria bacterium]